MHYRLYALNETTGKIICGADIIAHSDEEAILAGRAAYPNAPFEIWCRARRVFSSLCDSNPTA